MGPRMGRSNVLFEESGECAAAAQAPVGARIGDPRAGFRLRGAAQRHEPDAQTRVDPARIATAAATQYERRRQEVEVDPG
ncbi:hypothetical protein GCM10023307_25750 [Lysobacter hankyongensis]|uniref:Uncharacterized protein n=1 Tax=Lysobacter hankyongensis TaxID=1176535 RepID=A0ABP9BTT3_9GAMM